MLKFLAALSMVLIASPVFAQTPPTVTFAASSDHATVVGTTPVLTGYQLDVVVGTTTGAIAFTKSLGKPAPVGGNIVAPLPEFIGKPNGAYFARASATGPGGTSQSPYSDPFSWISGAPAAPGKPSIAEQE